MTSQAVVVAFSAGMVAAINPCGFALLPAYLAYFLGLDDPSGDQRASVLRALGVGATLTAGFVLVFGTIGVLLNVVALPIEANIPWITLVIGGGVVVLGVAMLAGFQPLFGLPRLDRGGQHRTSGSMLVFGISYAVASLSCTLPVFSVLVLGVFGADSFSAGVSVFLAYALGMGLLLTAATVAVALARQSLIGGIRRLLPYVGRIAGALLVLAGAFVIYWAWFELQVYGGNLDPAGPASTLLQWNTDVRRWADDTGPIRIGLALASFLAAALGIASWRSRSRDERVGGRADGVDNRASL